MLGTIPNRKAIAPEPCTTCRPRDQTRNPTRTPRSYSRILGVREALTTLFQGSDNMLLYSAQVENVPTRFTKPGELTTIESS